MTKTQETGSTSELEVSNEIIQAINEKEWQCELYGGGQCQMKTQTKAL